MGQLKVWGKTEPVLIVPGLQVHRITFEEGGVCSEHIHRYRNNAFYVFSGELLIRVWEPFAGKVTEAILRAHELGYVQATTPHQFEGIKSGVALEIYWSDEVAISEDDIHRFTQGFKR